jgi:integrase
LTDLIDLYEILQVSPNASAEVIEAAYRRLVRIKKEMGIEPKCRVHDLRHTFASNHINKPGVNLLALSRHMGHHSVAFTMDQYGHLNQQSQDEFVIAIDEHWQKVARLGEVTSGMLVATE